jgi:hypothetical protein
VTTKAKASTTSGATDQPDAGPVELVAGQTTDEHGVQTTVTTVDYGDDAGTVGAVILTVDNPETDRPATQMPFGGPCVVKDGTPHMGQAVNGKVCSAHANRYTASGQPRQPVKR